MNTVVKTITLTTKKNFQVHSQCLLSLCINNNVIRNTHKVPNTSIDSSYHHTIRERENCNKQRLFTWKFRCCSDVTSQLLTFLISTGFNMHQEARQIQPAHRTFSENRLVYLSLAPISVLQRYWCMMGILHCQIQQPNGPTQLKCGPQTTTVEVWLKF